MKISDLTHTHPEAKCKGRPCVIHNPSDHHMLEWPINLRENKLVERICEHGVGHPDPDSVYFFDMIGKGGLGIHCCCENRCCHEPEKEDLPSTDLNNMNIFEAGQVWQDRDHRTLIILKVSEPYVDYYNVDTNTIMSAPSFRVLPSQDWGLVFPNAILPGTVWRHKTDRDKGLVFILTKPDSNGIVDIAVANEPIVYEWSIESIREQYEEIKLNGR